jgi:hypothetical protein
MAARHKAPPDSLEVRNLKRSLADERARRVMIERERDQWRAMLVDAEATILVQARLLSGGRTLRAEEEIPF